MATLDAEPIGHILNRGCPGGVVSAGLKEGRAWGASFSFASSQEFFRVNQEQARPTPGFTGVLFQAEAALVLSLCFPWISFRSQLHYLTVPSLKGLHAQGGEGTCHQSP